jgi:hypothetical protein
MMPVVMMMVMMMVMVMPVVMGVVRRRHAQRSHTESAHHCGGKKTTHPRFHVDPFDQSTVYT